MNGRKNTHEIELHPDVVIKKFRSRSHGRPQREWRALCLLSEHEPGLAPAPIRSDLMGYTPTVVMSRLDGVPLRAPLFAKQQINAMAAAITAMHGAIPGRGLADLPPRAGYAPEAIAQARTWYSQCHALNRVPAVAQALDSGWSWLCRTKIGRPDAEGVTPVFGSGDGNLANHLWDGAQVRLVDFEYSGASDRAFELAEVTEHVSMWVDGPVDVASLLERFDLAASETARLLECRRLLAFTWLLMLSSDAASDNPRNPPGTTERQAGRLLTLLG